MTANPTASANGKNVTRNAGESWRRRGKRRRPRSSADCVKERKKKRRRGKKIKIRLKKAATAAVVQMKG